MQILTTKRLTLEHATVKDSDFFLALLNSPGWLKYIGDRGVKTLEDAVKYIDNSLIDAYKQQGFGLYKMTIKSHKKPIGICGFVKRDYLDHPDIGFAILPDYESQGYTYEAAKAIMSYGKNTLNLEQIHAITDANNIPSQQLLIKLGLSKTGIITPDNTPLLLFSDQGKHQINNH